MDSAGLIERGSPATLVAIIVAARRAGDRDLEREARRELQSQFGVKLHFASELEVQKGVRHE